MAWTGFGGGRGSINMGHENMASGNPSAANYGGGGGQTGLGGNGSYNRADYEHAQNVISGMGLVGTALMRDAGGVMRAVGVDAQGRAAWNTASVPGSQKAAAMAAAIGGGYGQTSLAGHGGSGGNNVSTAAGAAAQAKIAAGLAASATAGKLPASYIMQNGKVGQMITQRVPTYMHAHGDDFQSGTRQVTKFVEAPEMTKAWNTGVQQRAQQAAAQKAAAQKAAQAKAAADAAAKAAAQRAQAAKTAAAQQAAKAAQQAAAQKAAQAAAAQKAAQQKAAQTAAQAQKAAQQKISQQQQAKTLGGQPAQLGGQKPTTSQPTTRTGPTGTPITSLTNPNNPNDVATKEQANNANSLSGRINGTLSNIFGVGHPGTAAVGGFGSVGTISGTLMNGLSWAGKGMSIAGPAGALVGGLAGMINGSGTLNGVNLTGTNPNVAGVTSTPESFGPGQTLVNGVRVGNGNSRDRISGNKGPGTQGPGTQGPGTQGPGTQQPGGGVFDPFTDRPGVPGTVGVGLKNQNNYLQLLRGRYGKYLLATGAKGSGTGLMGRTVGGVGAVGGQQGKILLGG